MRVIAPSPTRSPHTVVHVLSSASVRGTAHVRIVAALARALDPDRYRLRAWFLDDSGPLVQTLASAGVPARAVIFSGRTDLAGAVRIARTLRADRPRLVHLHVGGRSRLWLLRGLSSAKRVAHVHGARTEDGTPLRVETFASSVQAVIATSKAVAAAVPGSATVVYPGVDVVDAVASPSLGPPTIGAMGRLEPIKGLAFLLAAAAVLRSRVPDLRIELAGSGACEPRLRSFAAQLGIADAVTFLGWRDDIDSLHRRWQVFAQPSIYEGLGLSVLEAMAAGRPVVASATGGLPELVEDGLTGFLVPAGEVGALVDRLGRLLDDEELRTRMGNAGRQRVRERFSVAEMAARTADVYDRLLTA
jgi:glycosyltransferase involved in cell wall biosynthesis